MPIVFTLAGVALCGLVVCWKAVRPSATRRIELEPISDAWLASHRGGHDDRFA